MLGSMFIAKHMSLNSQHEMCDQIARVYLFEKKLCLGKNRHNCKTSEYSSLSIMYCSSVLKCKLLEGGNLRRTLDC